MSVLALVAGSAAAFVQQRGDSVLAGKEFMIPEMEDAAVYARLGDLPSSLQNSSLVSLNELGVEPDAAIFDRRSGRWGALYPSLPLIPGNGVGNSLTWEGMGLAAPDGAEAIGQAAWGELSRYLSERADALGIDMSELRHRVGVHNDGALVQFSISREFRGVPVRGAVLGAGISHGNLALLGFDDWGEINLDVRPSISADDALVAVASFVAPLEIDALQEKSSLLIVPVSTGADFAIGDGYSHRLAWVVRPDVPADAGRWEAIVDAHTGELMAFRDLNSYGTERNVNGGVYPVTYDGIGPEGTMQDNYPMPNADITVGGPFTDEGGNFSGVGNATTTLVGDYIRIDDQCPGGFSESSTGDIDLGGTDGDVDCQTPTSGDNTASARSGFYELNRMVEQAQAHLPGNGWLQGTLEANMNINNSCNAFWNGLTINFYREGFPCGNTGQIGSVFDHEWGHGMDDNDVQGSVISSSNGGGEGIADLYASLRLDTSCVGRGFWIDGSLCGGYGDPCTVASGCSGIRDIDWANRASGAPHDLSWMQGNPSCGSVHCRGAVYSETVWDLFKRDLPSIYGMDNNTSMEVTTRLNYIAAGILSGWYPTGGSPHANCSANFSYNQFLLADDDNGNLADGTPHMAAIASAFDRHEIDCSPANGGPTVQDSGCAGNPTTAPVLTATEVNLGADLSWTAVAGASSYNIYRTDGVFGCDFGKAQVGSTAGTSFSDTGLKNGHPYFYTVLPIGSGGASCFGPASNCAQPMPGGGGLTIGPPMPGMAGVVNTFDASGATPNNRIYLFWSRFLGAGMVGVPGCPGMMVDINPANFFAGVLSDGSGNGTLSQTVPGPASGRTLHYQAVDRGSCTKSNVISFTYP